MNSLEKQPQWIHSTLLLQKRVPSQIQGRVFSFDALFYTVVSIGSRLAVGVLVDTFGIELTIIPAISVCVGIIPLTLWGIALFKTKKIDEGYAILPQISDKVLTDEEAKPIVDQT